MNIPTILADRKIIGPLVVICILCFQSVQTYAACNDWENLVTFERVYVQDTDRDRFGNLYVVGWFSNPNFIIGSTALTYYGSNTIFIIKFDKNLNVAWAKSMGNGSGCVASLVEVDGEDNVIVSGHFSDSPLSFDCIQLANSGRIDVFVAKYFPNGMIQWARHSTGSNDEFPKDLALTNENDVVVVGSFVEGSGSFEGVPVQSFGGYDSFIFKLSRDGSIDWATSIGGSGGNLPDFIVGVDVDANNDIVITGLFESEELYIGDFTIPKKTISENFFIAKVSSQGQALWAKGTGLNTDAAGFSVKVGADNSIFVLGRFYNGTITVGSFTLISAGEADALLIKYSPDGQALAALNFGGSGWDTGEHIELDPYGNLVVAGTYYSESFHIGPFTEFKAESSSDIFVARFDTELNPICLAKVSGNAELLLKSLDVDHSANIWVALENGFEFGQVVFDTDYVVESDVNTMFVSINDFDNFDTGLPVFEFDVNLGEDEDLCPNSNVILDAGQWCAASFTWQDGAHDRFYSVLQPGTYWVEVDVNGVVARDTINFVLPMPKSLDLGKDTTLCMGQSLMLDAGNHCGLTYEWQDGSTSSTFVVTQPGFYSVLIKDGSSTIIDEVHVGYHPVLDVHLGADKTICNNELVAFDVTQTFSCEYKWSDGFTLPIRVVGEPGTYWVQVQSDCESASDTIRIAKPGPLVVELGENITMCTGQSTTLGSELANAVSYEWQDGSTEPLLSINAAGTFSVRVWNGCIEKMDSVKVRVLNPDNLVLPNVITPNNDYRNDFFVIPEILQGSQLKIFNRWGEDVYYSSSYKNTWFGEDQSPGIYYYTLQGVCPDPIKGTIHLLKQ
jgi:CHU_C Type IX secretion signal domain